MPGEHNAENRRGRGRSPQTDSYLKIQFSDGTFLVQTYQVKLVEACAGGIGIASTVELQRFCKVTIWGNLGAGLVRQPASVRWCRPTRKGRFRIGLLLAGSPVAVKDEEFALIGAIIPKCAYSGASHANYFEVLGVEITDDAESVSRVYRALFERFGPQNLKTNDAALMSQLQRAYEVLSNPFLRQVYIDSMGISRSH